MTYAKDHCVVWVSPGGSIYPGRVIADRGYEVHVRLDSGAVIVANPKNLLRPAVTT